MTRKHTSKKQQRAREKARKKWLNGRSIGEDDERNTTELNIPKIPDRDEKRGFTVGFNMGWNAAKKEYRPGPKHVKKGFWKKVHCGLDSVDCDFDGGCGLCPRWDKYKKNNPDMGVKIDENSK